MRFLQLLLLATASLFPPTAQGPALPPDHAVSFAAGLTDGMSPESLARQQLSLWSIHRHYYWNQPMNLQQSWLHRDDLKFLPLDPFCRRGLPDCVAGMLNLGSLPSDSHSYARQFTFRFDGSQMDCRAFRRAVLDACRLPPLLERDNEDDD
ncbi:MAG: hypothetical protein SGCHY_000981 [Lobulomycetales sp.]